MTFYDVSKTLQTPNGTILNGITANGTADDKVNLQSYINYVHSIGGGTLIFPGNKTISITSQLTIYDNLTFRSSHGKTTLKAAGDNLYSFFNCSTKASAIVLDGIVFDANHNKVTHGVIFKGNANTSTAEKDANVTIMNCSFVNFTKGAQSVYIESLNNISIHNCLFDKGKGGIFIHKRNEHIRIKDNYFYNLNGHAIHLQGTYPDYCSDVIIEGNHIVIDKQLKNLKGVHGIYLTCGDVNFDKSSSHHENVIIANNTIIGPNLSFANKGSADLFSLKDIIRLKCYGNTARYSGDLGFAIERCQYGIVSNNTADHNNSCGISIFGSTHITVTGNVCSYNEQDHDHNNSKKLRSTPYGGIRVEFDSSHVLIHGNHFCGTGSKTRTQQYGIVVKSAIVPIKKNNIRTPHDIKIGVNHYAGNGLGDIYNKVFSTIIEDKKATIFNDII